MSENKTKCSFDAHKELESISFCQKCQIYMCKECEKLHSKLFLNHHKFEVDKNNPEIFTGLCNERNHFYELKYFCKTHNKLCCSECITKIKNKKIGKHTDCDICLIEDIEKDKKEKLEENIKCLEDLSINLQQSINDMKILLEKIEKEKEDIKINIQKIFTKIRNCINEKEDELLLIVDNKFEEEYFNEKINKNIEKLPIKVKKSLEKGKTIKEKWNENELIIKINDCLNIEENIIVIKKMNENIKKCNSNFKNDIKLILNEEDINSITENIKNINFDSIIFKDAKIEIDEQLIKSWLNKRKFKVELLFRKTRDGSNPNDFHNKCDNKGITITFIETTKGYKFGGYTELQWDKSNSAKKDKSTFIFSLNKKEKCLVLSDKSSISCYENYGPFFGKSHPEIYFYDTLDKGESYEYNSEYSSFSMGRKITNGDRYWDVKEIEIYKIEYI